MLPPFRGTISLANGEFIALLYVSMDDMGKLVQGDKKELQPK